MKTGFFTDMPATEYFSGTGRVSKTILMAHRKSPAHALHAMTAQQEATPAMRLGSLVHCLILEPGQLNARYAVGPDAARNTREWKEWSAEQSEGKELLRASEYADALAMTRWLEKKPTLAKLVRAVGPVESSVLWTETDAMTGTQLHFRARPDKLVQPGLLVDLKTTADISDRGIERTIANFGYNLQMALYMQGLAAVGYAVDHAVIVWVESAPPYEARATLLGESWLDLAEKELAVLKAKHAECITTGMWPGFPDCITDSEAPLWLTKENSNVL